MSGSMQLSLWAVATVLFVASALLPTTTAAPDQYIQIAGLITYGRFNMHSNYESLRRLLFGLLWLNKNRLDFVLSRALDALACKPLHIFTRLFAVPKFYLI
jgi:hypothetical protein